MGEAPLEQTLREVAATLVADAPFVETLQRIVELSCDIGTPAVAAELTLVDGRGRSTDAARSGGPATGMGETTGDAPLGAARHVRASRSARSPSTAGRRGRSRRPTLVRQRRSPAQAAVVVANARAYWELHEVASGLQAAMQSRAVIEQAKGMLMVTEGCTADEAFTLLARTSQRDNVKLRELARRIVDGEHDGRFALP